jgi:hypothetical protein
VFNVECSMFIRVEKQKPHRRSGQWGHQIVRDAIRTRLPGGKAARPEAAVEGSTSS